jgi:hypothetical protein
MASFGRWRLLEVQRVHLYAPACRIRVGYSRDLLIRLHRHHGTLIYFSTTSLREAVVTRQQERGRACAASNRELQELNQSHSKTVSPAGPPNWNWPTSATRNAPGSSKPLRRWRARPATNESLETLLPRLASLISEHFGFYHAGIFLLDGERGYTPPCAPRTAKAAKRMLARGHRLQVGQTGMVGFRLRGRRAPHRAGRGR